MYFLIIQISEKCKLGNYFPKIFIISLNGEKDKWWGSVFFFGEPKGTGKYATGENSAKNYIGNPQTDDLQCREQRGYWAAEAKSGQVQALQEP